MLTFSRYGEHVGIHDARFNCATPDFRVSTPVTRAANKASHRGTTLTILNGYSR
jgi:hypothetical protein